MNRLLRLLVRLLPADFRSGFGRSMAADLDQRQAAGDRAGLLRRDLLTLVGALVREHLSAFQQDLKHALRMMKRTPGFTSLAVLMLALGTGVNVAMFSVPDAVLLRFPFKDPARLVEVHQLSDGSPSALEPARFAELSASAHPFAALAVYDFSTHLLTESGDPRSVPLECVSASMFDVLGAYPTIGRAFGLTTIGRARRRRSCSASNSGRSSAVPPPLSGSIYGITPLDPLTLAACAAGMLVVALLAAFLPAWRATSVDPVVALRSS